MSVEQVLLDFENAVGEFCKLLNLFFVDMGFETDVLGAQHRRLNRPDNVPEAFIDALTHLPRIIDTVRRVFQLNDTL